MPEVAILEVYSEGDWLPRQEYFGEDSENLLEKNLVLHLFNRLWNPFPTIAWKFTKPGGTVPCYGKVAA